MACDALAQPTHKPQHEHKQLGLRTLSEKEKRRAF
jgi:hypothetical protein